MDSGSTSTNCNDRDNVMAVCPECFTQEKQFFASKCSECNSVVPFWTQCWVQALWSTVYVSSIIGGIYFIFWCFFG